MNDLVTGYSDTQFGPNDAITREQLTAILYRYADHLGLDTDTGFIPDKYYDFSDYQSVSRYATNAMSWCVNKALSAARTEVKSARDSYSCRSRNNADERGKHLGRK